MRVLLPAPWPQSGVIPYRSNVSGVEVLLITSRRRSRWGIPKGMLALRLGPAASAGREAYEEAGVRGCVADRAIGSYHYQKWGLRWRVAVYPMAVNIVLDQWTELGLRERCWFPAQVAAQQAANVELRALIAALPALIGET